MHQFAMGSSAAVGLLGGGSDGPPVGPETVGRPPSGFEAPPVPLRPFPTTLAAVPADVEEEAETDELPVAAEVRRLVVRLLGGEEVELGTFDDRSDAVEAAQELIARFSAAEVAGEWPEVEGRFLRLDSVVSIDVLVAD
jgi:hypothetical protein